MRKRPDTGRLFAIQELNENHFLSAFWTTKDLEGTASWDTGCIMIVAHRTIPTYPTHLAAPAHRRRKHTYLPLTPVPRLYLPPL